MLRFEDKPITGAPRAVIQHLEEQAAQHVAGFPAWHGAVWHGTAGQGSAWQGKPVARTAGFSL